MRTTEEIVESIDNRLRQLKDEIATLDAARAAFDARENPPSRRRPARRPARATSPTRRPRASKAIPADRLEFLLSKSGGLTTSALAAETGESRDNVLTLLRELESAGRVRRTGQRRATRWHAITDEDRIRARAAELEATRKRPA